MAMEKKGVVEEQRSVSAGKYLISSVMLEGEKYPLDIFESDATKIRPAGTKVSVVIEVGRKSGKLQAKIQ